MCAYVFPFSILKTRIFEVQDIRSQGGYSAKKEMYVGQ